LRNSKESSTAPPTIGKMRAAQILEGQLLPLRKWLRFPKAISSKAVDSSEVIMRNLKTLSIGRRKNKQIKLPWNHLNKKIRLIPNRARRMRVMEEKVIMVRKRAMD
jgi:hypothetical protein